MPDLAAPPAAVLGRAQSDDDSLSMIVVDDDCRCLEANLGASRLLGVSPDEVVGQLLEDFLVDDARDSFRHVWLAFRVDGGHAGPFMLNAGMQVAVSVSVTADVAPSRHLLVLTQEAGPRRRRPSQPPLADDQLGAPPRAGADRRSGPTIREREVLRLLATGATDGQIATLLELSPATVQTHVRNAKAKLGARTRAQAVALALQRGMIRSG